MNLIQKLIDVIDDKNINDIFNGINNLSKYSSDQFEELFNNFLNSILLNLPEIEEKVDLKKLMAEYSQMWDSLPEETLMQILSGFGIEERVSLKDFFEKIKPAIFMEVNGKIWKRNFLDLLNVLELSI